MLCLGEIAMEIKREVETDAATECLHDDYDQLHSGMSDSLAQHISLFSALFSPIILTFLFDPNLKNNPRF